MDTLEKADFTVSIRHMARFLKSEIPICNSEVLDTASKTFHANAITAFNRSYCFIPLS